MKRIISLLLTLLILITSVPTAAFSVFAASTEYDSDGENFTLGVENTDDNEPQYTEPTFIVSDAEITVGDEVAEFTLSVVNNPGIWGIMGYLNYDERMSLADFKNGAVFTDSDLALGGPMESETMRDIVIADNRLAKRTYDTIGVSYVGVLATQVFFESVTFDTVSTNGTLVDFTLNTSSLEAGTYEIAFYFDSKGVLDGDGNTVYFEAVYGTLTVNEAVCEHEYEETVVPSTCTEGGYTIYQCVFCEYSYLDSFTEATGHNYTESVVPPACLGQGYVSHICENCGDSYGDNYTEALGHDFDEGSETKAPTCIEEGVWTKNCQRDNCDGTVIIVDEGDHLPSCTGSEYVNNMYKTYTYSYPGAQSLTFKFSTNSEIESSFDKIFVYEGETADGTAITSFTGSLSGRTFTVNSDSFTLLFSTDYSQTRYGFEIVKVEAEIYGQAIETTPIAALGHDYEGSDEIVPPTCTDEGYTLFTCVRCSHTYTDLYTDALGHEYSETEVAPTCSAKGYTLYTCGRCDYSYEDNFTEALGHIFDDGFEYKAPSCEENGLWARTCQRESCDGTIVIEDDSLPSCTESDYLNSMNKTFTYSYPGAESIEITFSSDSELEIGYDYIYIYEGSSVTESSIETFTGSFGNASVTVYADAFTIRMKTDGSVTKYGFKVSSVKVKMAGNAVALEEVDALGHDYEGRIETVAPTCTQQGYTLYSCSRCDYSYADNYVDALGHNFELFSIMDSTCTEYGIEEYSCLRCGAYMSIAIEPHGHEYGEWIVDKEPLLLEEGHRYRECAVCGDRLEEAIDRIKIDYEEETGYGLAVFTVVNAQSLEPIENAQIFIATENDGEDTFVTDADGKVSIVLPVGEQTVSAYAEGCIIRNIKFNIGTGINELSPIGLSSLSTYDAKITSTVMTQEEIIEAGIDITAPENQHVVKYEMKIQYSPEVDWESITFYFNADGDYIVPDPKPVPTPDDDEDEEETYVIHYHVVDTSHRWCRVENVEYNTIETLSYTPTRVSLLYTFDGWYEDASFTKKITSKEITEKVTYVYGRWLYLGDPDKKPSPTPPSPSPSNDKIVYPISENFYLIINGQVKWQKEMFDVEMLIINNSMTDTLEDITATLELPEGLSLATMSGEQQSATQYVGHVGEGETRSVHWYVRGDVAGSYALEARLTGVTMPYGEIIDDVFRSEEMLQVWAGNALDLNFEFPDAAYYADDYPIRITLTNVSDRSLYNVSHGLNITQGMEIYYSDGTDKKKIDTSSWFEVGIGELRPGDSIVIETSTNIFFESEMMERELERYLSLVDGIEVLYKTAKVVSFFTDCAGFVSGCIDGSIASIDGLLEYGDYLPDVKLLLGGFWAQLIELNEMYKNYKDAALDATTGIIVSEVEEELVALTEDPEKWMETHDKRDIQELISKIKILISIVKGEPETERFDIFDSLRTAISSIPIKFAFQSVIFNTDASSTTAIPYSYTVYDAGPRYFGVSSVSKYMDALTIAVVGTAYEELVPWYVQLIPGLDDPMDMEEAIKYIQATEKEITKLKAKDATGEVTFRAWVEKSPAAYMMRTTVTTEDFALTSDNKNATYEDGVLTFTGDGTIMVEPLNMNGGTLYIEDSEGNLYTYVIGVVEQHECCAGEAETVVSPTAKTEGFGVRKCAVCDDILDVVIMSSENCEHSFTEWETKAEATCTDVGLISRSCIECGMLEQEFTEMLPHTEGEWETVEESTCTALGTEQTFCTICDTVMTREVEMLPHTEGEWRVFKAPAAFETGINRLHCSVCDAVLLEAEIPMTQESFGLELGNETRLVTGIPLYITPAMLISHYENMGMEISVTCATAYVGTGCTIVYEDVEFTVIIAGDIYGDGILNSRDSLLQKTYITQKALPTEEQRISADIDGNGVLNARDTLALKKLLMK